MSELTDEPMTIAQHEQLVIAREQWKIAADQFFREALFSVSQKVNQGVYDPYVLEVGKQLYKSFRDANLPQGTSHEDK